MTKTNDSTQETQAHIHRVSALLRETYERLQQRAFDHDRSKLLAPEKECFDEVTGALRALTYGSPEYKEQLAKLKPALDHHYANNSHHPEHYADGVDGMSMLDLIEMLCDWKAAGERHADGSMERSLRVNKDRFKVSDQLQRVLENSASEMGWLQSGAEAPAPLKSNAEVSDSGESERGKIYDKRTPNHMPKNYCNCPNCRTENCPASLEAVTVAAPSASQRKTPLAARRGWAADATTEEKAMAYDLLVAGEQVKQSKASQALWIAHTTGISRIPRPATSSTSDRLTRSEIESLRADSVAALNEGRELNRQFKRPAQIRKAV